MLSVKNKAVKRGVHSFEGGVQDTGREAACK